MERYGSVYACLPQPDTATQVRRTYACLLPAVCCKSATAVYSTEGASLLSPVLLVLQAVDIGMYCSLQRCGCGAGSSSRAQAQAQAQRRALTLPFPPRLPPPGLPRRHRKVADGDTGYLADAVASNGGNLQRLDRAGFPTYYPMCSQQPGSKKLCA